MERGKGRKKRKNESERERRCYRVEYGKWTSAAEGGGAEQLRGARGGRGGERVRVFC